MLGVMVASLSRGTIRVEYPWPFTGTVKRVVVDVSEQGGINLEVEAQMMLMRE